ncbi:MAG: acyltransferase [Bacteroidales bacterium]|nr:acyltransferase [Bacteroidales bacterium]
MNTTISRNPAIEFFRFVFIGIIVLWHFSNIVPIFQCGDFAVDFFFILSGAMLYRSFIVHPGQDSVKYTFNRIRRIFFEWILVLVPVFIIKFRDWLFIDGHLNKDNLLEYALKFIHEIFFLGETGLFNGSSHYASWFISALIVGGFILYSALYFFKERCPGFYFPVFAMLSLVFLYKDGFPGWGIIGCFKLQLLKGTAEMAIGATIYHYAERYQQSLKKYHTLIDFISLAAIAMWIVLLFNDRKFSPYSILFCSLILVSLLVDNSLMVRFFSRSSRLWLLLGGISFEMLLTHGLVKPIVSYLNIGMLPPLISVTLYLLLVIASAFGLKEVNKKASPLIFR